MTGMRTPGSSSWSVEDDEFLRHLAEDDPDFLEKVLAYTGATSPELRAALDQMRQAAFPPRPIPVTAEEKRRAKQDIQRERADFYSHTDTGIF